MVKKKSKSATRSDIRAAAFDKVQISELFERRTLKICRFGQYLHSNDVRITTLASVTGIRASLLTRYRQGVEPGAWKAMRIAKALGATMEELWTPLNED